MPWLYLALLAMGGLALAALLCLLTIRQLGRRAPYASFLRLSVRRKFTFVRLLLQDNRVPVYIKLLPLAVVVYFISPIDLLPLSPLDDLALALVALALIIRFTPRHVLKDLLERAAAADAIDRKVGR